MTDCSTASDAVKRASRLCRESSARAGDGARTKGDARVVNYAIGARAVGAKSVALRLSGSGVMSERVTHGIEIAGTGFVFLLGSTLLAASLI